MVPASSPASQGNLGLPPRASKTATAALLLGLLSPLLCVCMLILGSLLTRIEPVADLVNSTGDGVLVVAAIWLIVLPALPGIVLGFFALGEIRRQPELKGRKRAIAGIILGFLSPIANY